MKIVHLPLAIVIALSLGTAFAQTNKPAPAAPSTADCEKRHDHRAEKGNPVPASARCPDTAPKSKSAASKPHDHGKMHKQQ